MSNKNKLPKPESRDILTFDGTGDSCDAVCEWLGRTGKWCVWNSNTFTGGKVYSTSFGWIPFGPGDTIMSIPSGYAVIYAKNMHGFFSQLPVAVTVSSKEVSE
jgi:hypothetical protein